MNTDFESMMAGLAGATTDTDQSPTPQATVQTQSPIIQQPMQTEHQGGQLAETAPVPHVKSPLFETKAFRELVREDSISRNMSYARNTVNLGGYDIAHNCIKTTLFRMLGHTPSNYANSWLPLSFRAALGTAVHAYIQDLSIGKIFSECEICLKVPSRHLSMRLDAVINDDTLVEIKSCAYADYKKILKTNQPRLGDLHQAIFYRYLLQNHLAEMKEQEPTRGGKKPGLDDYSNIRYIQMIYVCHEIISAESETMAEEVRYATAIRKLAKAQSGMKDFWFIAPLVMDTTQFDIKMHEDYLVKKMEETLKYLELKQLPPDNHPYVDNSKCFFCQFKDQCNAHK